MITGVGANVGTGVGAGVGTGVGGVISVCVYGGVTVLYVGGAEASDGGVDVVSVCAGENELRRRYERWRRKC